MLRMLLQVPSEAWLTLQHASFTLLVCFTHGCLCVCVSLSSYRLLVSGCLQVSLFFDMLLALAKDVTREAYEAGCRSGAYGRGSALEAGSQIQVDEGISDLLASASDKPDPTVNDRKKAHKVIWELLREHGVGMQAGESLVWLVVWLPCKIVSGCKHCVAIFATESLSSADPIITMPVNHGCPVYALTYTVLHPIPVNGCRMAT